jgi:hypothetical protein
MDAIALIQKNFLLTIMDYQPGQQLSLIAEDFGCEPEVGDWHGDTRNIPLRERSIEEIRAHFVRSMEGNGGQTKNRDLFVEGNGGQTQTRILSMEGNGGQTSQIDGGQNKNLSIFDRSRGDDGTWIEKQKRKSGEFEYLRWREPSGIKRSKYLGKVA